MHDLPILAATTGISAILAWLPWWAVRRPVEPAINTDMRADRQFRIMCTLFALVLAAFVTLACVYG